MNDYIYGIVEEIYSLEGISRTAYGLAVYAKVDDGIFTVLATENDLSSDRAKLEHLAELCNRLELDILHLTDISIDFLG